MTLFRLSPMRRSPKTILPLVMLSGLISVSCGEPEPQKLQEPCAGDEPVATGEALPTGKALAEDIPSTADFDIDACGGKVVVLNFWATWCGPCRMEIPALVKLRDSFPKAEVAIIGISTGEYIEGEKLQTSLKSFIARLGINYPIFSDEDRLAYRRYNKQYSFGSAIPATLVFDKQGEIVAVHRGVPQDRSGRINPYAVLGEEIQNALER